ncbi:hypothetical protein GCM10010172_54590 [Paractinoplanes ferrugineus]|uniref:YcxB-like protein domain-containing protein n=1 Tax=Paractinoplanes ferrugineus TaxID=113564 RepID=A0A919J0M2_9ACTN|nr:YcxB family protein [Actinoplanes ferrugineus]GIE11723.1 hypothetical protein Afe05nite_35630 [Actinoplanes ferrugineus]
MFFTISAQPDARLIASAVRRGLRPVVLTARLLGWAFIALALTLEIVHGGGYLTLVLTGALLAVGVPMLLINAGTREALSDSALTTYEITDGGVASSSLESRHAYSWTAFSGVEDAPGQLIFRRGPMRVLPVPTGSLTRPQIDQILSTAAGHGVRVRGASAPVSPRGGTPAAAPHSQRQPEQGATIHQFRPRS